MGLYLRCFDEGKKLFGILNYKDVIACRRIHRRIPLQTHFIFFFFNLFSNTSDFCVFIESCSMSDHHAYTKHLELHTTAGTVVELFLVLRV